MVEFNGVYERLGISFDEVLGESAYNDQLPSVVSNLQKKLQQIVKVLSLFNFQKSIPPSAYVTAHWSSKSGTVHFCMEPRTWQLWSIDNENWDPDEIIYVTDTRQQLHFLQVFETWNQWRKLRRTKTWKNQIVPHLVRDAQVTRRSNVDSNGKCDSFDRSAR